MAGNYLSLRQPPATFPDVKQAASPGEDRIERRRGGRNWVF
jgi:hypothetical protein